MPRILLSIPPPTMTWTVSRIPASFKASITFRCSMAVMVATAAAHHGQTLGSLIVIDPRRSETAEKADIHLAVKPGTDAWLLAAMLGLLVQNDWVDHDWIAQHTSGYEDIVATLSNIDVARCAAPPAPAFEQVTRFMPDVAGEYTLRLVVTDDDGFYMFPAVLPGAYTITVTPTPSLE